MSMYEMLYRKNFHSFASFAFRECYPGKYFYDNWHIELISDLMQFLTEYKEEGAPRKVVFNLPPDHFKTHLCSIFFPAWLLGRDPRLSVLIISENSGAAFELQERCAELMRKARFRSLFPRAKIKKEGDSIEFVYGGCIQHTGIYRNSIRQKNDLIIIDNPQSLQSLDRLDPNILYELPRLLKDPKQGLIIMNTRRLGAKDMTYHLQQIAGWTNFSFPIVSPEDRELVFPPFFEYNLNKGEPLHPDRTDWPEVESILKEFSWNHFLYQHMQGCYQLDKRNRSHTTTVDKDGKMMMIVGELGEDFIARQEFKKLRENYEERYL